MKILSLLVNCVLIVCLVILGCLGYDLLKSRIAAKKAQRLTGLTEAFSAATEGGALDNIGEPEFNLMNVAGQIYNELAAAQKASFQKEKEVREAQAQAEREAKAAAKASKENSNGKK